MYWKCRKIARKFSACLIAARTKVLRALWLHSSMFRMPKVWRFMVRFGLDVEGRGINLCDCTQYDYDPKKTDALVAVILSE